MNQIPSGNAYGYQDLMNTLDNMSKAQGNQVTSPPGLVIGSGSNVKVKVANTTTGLAGNVPFSKTTAEVAFTATTHNIPANATSVQERVYAIACSSAGTLTIVPGTIATGAGTALLPERSATLCYIGYVRIAVNAAAPGAGTSFIANTTALDDARMTVTYTDGYPLPLFSAAQ